MIQNSVWGLGGGEESVWLVITKHSLIKEARNANFNSIINKNTANWAY